MKSDIKVETTTTLQLDEREAAWLRGIVQNPLCVTETEVDRGMRERFFNNLPDESGVKNGN